MLTAMIIILIEVVRFIMTHIIHREEIIAQGGILLAGMIVITGLDITIIDCGIGSFLLKLFS